jgi:hypothetical protein
MNEKAFAKGLRLSELFYHEAVRPFLEEHFPGLEHSAALLGKGSEVLGFDTPQSMDHDWGPRLMLFLAETDCETYADEIDQTLRQRLPRQFHGYPTNFGYHEDGTRVMEMVDDGPIDHLVMILSPHCFFRCVLNFDPSGEIRAIDWVSVPQYFFLMLTAGRVFHDGLDQLEPARERLRYYPHDVWLYLLASQWRRIAQEEAFLGRCGQVGDDLGARMVATRLVHDLMQLCFLMEQRYAPFIKWLGSAFAQLDCADDLLPVFMRVLGAGSWRDMQNHLTTAYEVAAEMHNALGITETLATRVSQFYKRPFLVLHAGRFSDAIRAQITSEQVLALPEHLGSVDQWIDSTDALKHLTRFRGVYG